MNKKLTLPNKTKEAVEMWKSGNIRAAMRIFSSFKLGLTKDERRALQIHYECLTGKSGFYTSIGIDVAKIEEESKSLILNKFINGGKAN